MKYGFSDLNEKTGEFKYTFLPYLYSTSKTEVNLRISGNDIVNVDDDLSITLSDKYIKRSRIERKWSAGNLGILDNLIPDLNYELIGDYKDSIKYEDVKREIDKFVPEYEDLSPETGSSKYSKKMDLKEVSNVPKWGRKSFVASMWYGGYPEDASLVGDNVRAIKSGSYNPNNVMHPRLKLLMEASKDVADKYGSEYIYRGETNPSIAKAIISSIFSGEAVELPDKLSSWTENEKLGKWYASVHKQQSPSTGTEIKTNIMLKINKDKYLDNVIFDYRVCGSTSWPEQEISIIGSNIKLTGDDVMVYGVTPKRKNKKWLSLSEYINEGGSQQELMDQMVI